MKEKQINSNSIATIPLKELQKAPWNPRKISEEQKLALQKSLKEFGNVEPIIWNKQTNHVVGGHQRLDALIALGETSTDVIVIDIPEEREQVLNIALNKISGEWDFGKLSDILLSLHEDVRELTGFQEDEIARILSAFDIKGINDPNEEWVGLTEYDSEDLTPFRKLIVNFKNKTDIERFAALVNQKITDQTRYIWFPQKEADKVADLRCIRQDES